MRAYTSVAAASLLVGAALVAVAPQTASAGPDSSAVTVAPASVALSASARAAQIYAGMTRTQRVGQLFMAMVSSSGPSSAELSTLRKDAVGNFYLSGNTNQSVHAMAATTHRLRTHATYRSVEPFVGSDEEGGVVQRLRGAGFTRMPTALVQGSWSPATLQRRTKSWGAELRKAGVELNLAPVADTVPAKNAHANAPIGQYDREFGHTPGKVASHVVAFVRGMAAAHVDTTLKHFPGEGRATGHTDTSSHVTDPTTRHDAYLKPFRDGIAAGAPFVMVSSATYPHIDSKHRACFSHTVMVSMLRGDLRFRGVIISDAFETAAIASVPVASRGVKFFGAGGTIVLDRTVRIHTMAHAVRAKMAVDPAFATKVKAAVMAVLVAKVKAGLIG